MTKPMNPRRPPRAQNGPRIFKRSLEKVTASIMKKQKTYGGALRPFDWICVNDPIWLMIVGTKSGSEANETLQEKYISAGM